MHEIDEAIISIQEFISDGNVFIPAYSLLGYMYSEYKGDYGRVINLLEKTFGTSPRDLRVINNLAYNYLMMGNTKKAKDLLEQVDEGAADIFLIATKGLLEIKQGNVDKGRELYNKAAERSVDERLRKQILQKKELEIGRSYIAANKIAEAELQLEKAIKIKIEDSVYTNQIKGLLSSLA
jgi:tetratricopeptide (TPR) repeat protein